MGIRTAVVLALLVGLPAAAYADDYRIEEAASPQNWDVAQIKPGTIVFSDLGANAKADAKAIGNATLTPFVEWGKARPLQKRFLSLFPAYEEPTVPGSEARQEPGYPEALHVCGASTFRARPWSHGDRSDPLRDARVPAAHRSGHRDKPSRPPLPPLKDHQGAGNENPVRHWCSGRPTLVCIQSSYALKGRIPLGILLVNKLRGGPEKISEHINFYSELSELPSADMIRTRCSS